MGRYKLSERQPEYGQECHIFVSDIFGKKDYFFGQWLEKGTKIFQTESDCVYEVKEDGFFEIMPDFDDLAKAYAVIEIVTDESEYEDTYWVKKTPWLPGRKNPPGR